MIRAARFRPSLLWGGIALGSMFVCSAAAFADEALWKMYVETGAEAYEAGRYATAETMFLAACTEAEGFGANDLRLASTLFQLARVYNREDKDEKVELECRRAIEIWDASSAPASIKVAVDLSELLTKLAGELRGREKYAEAEPLYKRAQEIAEKYFAPDDPHLAEALTAQAKNFYDGGKYDEAEPLYKRALDIIEKNKGSEDGDVVNAIRPLALTLFAQKKFDQARLLTERAIAILEKNKKPDYLAAPLTFLGLTCENLGRYADAERAYKRALDTLGRDNSGALDTLENYSRMLRYLEREPEAEALEARIRRIRTTTSTRRDN